MNVEERIEAMKAELKCIDEHISTLRDLKEGMPDEVNADLSIICITSGSLAKGGHSLIMGNALDIAGILNDLTDEHEELLPLMEACDARNQIRKQKMDDLAEELEGLTSILGMGSPLGGRVKVGNISNLLDMLKKRVKKDKKAEAPVDDQDKGSEASSQSTTEE